MGRKPGRTGPNRVHLDLYADNQLAEIERLTVLGATQLVRDYPPGADYVVMADPDGNEFCVISSPYSQS
ncbi:MAG: VOC family protein [Janthinobacterium lividum]